MRPVIVLGAPGFSVEEEMWKCEYGVVFKDWHHISYVIDQEQARRYIDHITGEPLLYERNRII